MVIPESGCSHLESNYLSCAAGFAVGEFLRKPMQCSGLSRVLKPTVFKILAAGCPWAWDSTEMALAGAVFPAAVCPVCSAQCRICPGRCWVLFGMVGEQGQTHLSEDLGLKGVHPADGCEKLALVCQLQQL